MGIQWPHHCGVIRIQDKKDKKSSSHAFKIAIISITLFSFTRWLLNTLWRKIIGRGAHTYYKLLLPKSIFSCFEHIITVGCTSMYIVHRYCNYEAWAIPCSFTYNHILCNSILSAQIFLPFHVFRHFDFLEFSTFRGEIVDKSCRQTYKLVGRCSGLASLALPGKLSVEIVTWLIPSFWLAKV